MVRHLLIPALVITVAAGLAGCSSENDTEAGGQSTKPDSLCGVAKDSAAHKALIDLAGTKDMKSMDFAGVAKVAKDMKSNLTAPLEDRKRSACGVYPATDANNGITFDFSWDERFSFKESSSPQSDAVFYNLGDAVGQTLSDKASYIYLPCDVPGAKESGNRLVAAHAYNSMPQNGQVEENSGDNQLLVLNAVSRELVSELGCANDPLKGAPDLKHYPTMSDAAGAPS
ncbi:hypothetical protein AB0I82_15415 [Streptomyces sp. NPDC050315]|uniref:hypothetical protein n=1 Tax=Streptomyces sp. NPDC050315 TaxID=3155039 RepID=UPI00343D34A9